MEQYLDRLGQLSHSAAQRLHVRSALNPILWLCAIATPTIFLFGYLFKDQPQICVALLIAGFIPVGVACLGFAYFALAKPEKLQSEDYQIRHESLQIIQQKGKKAISLSSVAAIANPAAPRLTDGRSK